jgi:hypothetical protein
MAPDSRNPAGDHNVVDFSLQSHGRLTGRDFFSRRDCAGSVHEIVTEAGDF